LLFKLLEKDPAKRISIAEAKLHPWTTADLKAEETKEWLSSSDPSMYGAPVSVTDEEVSKAVTMMSFLKKRIRKLSSSLYNLAGILGKHKKTASMEAPPGTPLSTPGRSLSLKKYPSSLYSYITIVANIGFVVIRRYIISGRIQA
jgi:[calcium/calmodulin-dependent protein kinase] kinase